MKKIYNKMKIMCCYSLKNPEDKKIFMYSNINDNIKKYL